MIDAQPLGDQAILGCDHVHVAVARETGLEAVAGLARLAVTDAVGKDQEEPLGIEQAARPKQLAGETRAHILCPAAAGAVEDEDGVADDALGVALRLAERAVMESQLGERLAGGEAEVLNDKIALRRRGDLGRSEAGERGGDEED